MSLFFSSSQASENPKVVVIGAGIAGLTAAYRLQQQGVDVEVYEARQRVGGRVLTINLAGKIVELGGHNITDGGEAENLHRLINEFGLELTSNKISLSRIFFDGSKLIPHHDLLIRGKFKREDLRNQIDKLISKSKNMQEILDEIVDRNDPLYKMLAVRLAAYEGASPEDLSTLYAETLYYMLLGGLSSAHQCDEGEECFVHLLTFKEGNARLLEKMAEKLDPRLHLNMPLKTVAKGNDQSFILTFSDGWKVKADTLVLAIPCSVYEDIIFEDEVIPNGRLESIKSVRSGSNAKILIPFPSADPSITGCINEQAISFFDPARQTLILYCTGAMSYFSKNSVNDIFIKAKPMLEKAFAGCPFSTAPIIAEDRSYVTYEQPVGYSWPNDPYAKGTYSFISPGQESLLTSMEKFNGESVKTLFAPIDQKLFFAGEHTSILMDVPGTMEAACESGERAARMIIKSIEENDDE